MNMLSIELRQSLASPHEYLIFESNGGMKKQIGGADTRAAAEKIRDARRFELNKAELDRLARAS